MAYTPKDMTGSLWRNERKEKPTHPDHKGEIVVAGTRYELAAWVREAKNGKKFFSIAVSVPRERTETQQPAAPATDNGGASDDTIPF